MNDNTKKLLRELPSIDELAQEKEKREELSQFSKLIVTEAARQVIHDFRTLILKGELTSLEYFHIVETLIKKTRSIDRGNLRKVINATGVVLHTNLGRALLSKKAIASINKVSSSFSNLEVNLDTGERGSRYSHVEGLLIKLTGAEAALVVNNNAAAVLLVLSTLAKDKEVIVSRGQLVEIGGAFRIPEVMSQSGAILKEVGTTNKTYPGDYENAISENTALLLKVHTSNYRVVGFTHDTSLEELVTLGKERGIPVVEDVGSGFLVDLKEYGICDEPTVQESIRAGADVVTFSGDKLLGGPQAGIIVGKKEFVEQMKRNPLTRALRIDKLTVAALEGTLIDYIDSSSIVFNNPTLRMLTYSEDELLRRAELIKRELEAKLDKEITIQIDYDYSQVGGGALPTTKLKTKVLKLEGQLSTNSWAECLRQGEPSVMVRVKENQIILDPRTISDEEVPMLVEALRNSLMVGERCS